MSTDYNKMDGGQKMFALCCMSVCLLIGYLVELNFAEDRNYIKNGYQKCYYIVPGKAEVLTVWQKECQSLMSFDPNYKPQ